jgi:hypothetical protein
MSPYDGSCDFLPFPSNRASVLVWSRAVGSRRSAPGDQDLIAERLVRVGRCLGLARREVGQNRHSRPYRERHVSVEADVCGYAVIALEQALSMASKLPRPSGARDEATKVRGGTFSSFWKQFA